jgi:LPS biosynthesis protein
MKCYTIEENGKMIHCIEDFEEQYRQTIIEAYYVPDGNRLIKVFDTTAGIEDMQAINENFLRLCEDMFTSQKADWVKALITFSNICNANNISWGLTGSATDALRGANIIPHDIDIYVHTMDFYRVKQIFLNYLIEPFQDLKGTWVVRYFGRLCICGIMVEIAADVKRNLENYDYDEVEWGGKNILMDSFQSRYETEILRDRKDRIKALEEIADLY